MNETYECPKCNGKFTLPAEINEQVRLELAEACRGPGKIDAMSLIRTRLHVSLGDSKFMVVHISGVDGVCGQCAHKLLESGITYCPSCNSLNLNW
ncbi:MAG: hypothetical protein QM730_17900 [Anaerolineales bacterium]